MNMLLRDTFVEINLDSIEYNVRLIREIIGLDVQMAAVIKGDAYGFGAVEIAPTIMRNGADCLMVATLTEAMELRRCYKQYKIIVLGYTPNEYMDFAVENNIALTIFTINQARHLDYLGVKYHKTPIVYIKYDTGLHRIGYLDCASSIEEIQQIFEFKSLRVEGIFSHLAQAGEYEDRIQCESFLNAVNKIEMSKYKFKYKSMCESIGLISYPEYRMNMVRPGTIIYGTKSFKNEGINFKSAITFKTKIIQIKKVMQGEGVGYKYDWKPSKNSLIGTLPVGFADGLPRHLYKNGYVIVHSKKVPFAGYICMDQCMIDLTNVPEAKIGDEVIIYGDGAKDIIDIETAADMLETTKGDILCRITRRVPRVYLKGGKIIKIRDYLLDEVVK